MRRELRLALLAALVSRLIPAPFFGHPWDMYVWLKSGEMALSQVNIYLVENLIDYPWGFYAYPPTWLYWLMIASAIGAFFNNLNLQVFFIKLPIIVSDVIVGLMVYKLGMKLGLGEKKALIASIAWLFNPVSLFMSSIWGMFDSIAVLFMLLAMNYVVDEKYERAGAMIGIGAAVKILPVLLIPPTIVYLVKSGRINLRESVKKMIVPSAAIFLAFSAPFLTTPVEYFRHIFQHTKSVGSFTYWTVLSNFINISSFWFVSIIVFTALIILAYRRKWGGGWQEYVGMSAATVAAFLATSPKVNIQYLLTLIPLLLLFSGFWRSKQTMLNFVILMITGIVWFASSASLLANYSLDYLGKLFIPQTYEFGPWSVLMVASAVFAGTRLVTIALDLIGMKKFDVKILSKWSVIAILLIFSIMVSLFPTPVGVMLPRAPRRIAVPESPDSGFIPRSSVSVDRYLKQYDVNYVVLSFSPDFINTYKGFRFGEDVTKYFRFKTGSNAWRHEDLIWLIRELHARDVKVLLGVYLRAEQVKHHYGVHGFSISWIKAHPQVLGARNVLLFNGSIHLDSSSVVPYAEYFAEKVVRVMEDFGFDGVYLMSWNPWRIRNPDPSYILPLLSSLRSRMVNPIFVESADTTRDIRNVLTLLDLSDYVVLKTAPWVNTIYYARMDNATMADYELYVKNLLKAAPPEKRNNILYSIHVLDFVEGWATPAVEVQAEANKFYDIGLRSGYVIYYASRYVPYRITISEKYLESEAHYPPS